MIFYYSDISSLYTHDKIAYSKLKFEWPDELQELKNRFGNFKWGTEILGWASGGETPIGVLYIIVQEKNGILYYMEKSEYLPFYKFPLKRGDFKVEDLSKTPVNVKISGYFGTEI